MTVRDREGVPLVDETYPWYAYLDALTRADEARVRAYRAALVELAAVDVAYRQDLRAANPAEAVRVTRR